MSPFPFTKCMHEFQIFLRRSDGLIMKILFFRLTPFEWENPHPCVEEPEELENELTLHNCFWHNWGSLMQQGSDIAPK